MATASQKKRREKESVRETDICLIYAPVDDASMERQAEP